MSVLSPRIAPKPISANRRTRGCGSAPRAMHRDLRIPNLRKGDDSPLAVWPAIYASRRLPITDPAALPLPTQRHIPNSMATMRIRLVEALANHLP
jgi:hypothetical protein